MTWQDTSRGPANTAPLTSALEAWSQVVGGGEKVNGHLLSTFCMPGPTLDTSMPYFIQSSL